MYKQFAMVLLTMIWASNLLGQIQNSMKKALRTQNFAVFKQHIYGLAAKNKLVEVFNVVSRDIITGYQESVYEITKSSDASSYSTFRVALVTTKNSIVCYNLSEERYSSNNYIPIDKFKNNIAFRKFKTAFKLAYQSDLQEDDLFITDFVYGSHCSIAGQDPKGRQQINKWVKNKNKTDLLKWLKSANTEKQIYAIDGLLQLKNQGIELTSSERKIIQLITNKKGKIYTCGGCIHLRRNIKDVARDFKF